MPKFLEDKLRAEYGDNPHAIYGTMNKIGAMHGNKETAKGKAMAKKHAADMKRGPHKPATPKPKFEHEAHAYNFRSRKNLKRGT